MHYRGVQAFRLTDQLLTLPVSGVTESQRFFPLVPDRIVSLLILDIFFVNERQGRSIGLDENNILQTNAK